MGATNRAVAAPGKAHEKLRLTSQGRKLLKKAKRVKIVGTATFTPTGTTATTVTRSFTLKR